MSSMIILGIDKLEIDWGKYNRFADHSILFLQSDITLIPYYDDVVEMKEGFSRKLGSIKRRLDLLGYSLQTILQKYEEHLGMMSAYYSDVAISFEQFRRIINSIDFETIPADSNYGVCNLDEFISYYVLRDPEVRRCLSPDIEIGADLNVFFANLDPYLTLRLLAENEKNVDRLVQWRSADAVEVADDMVVTDWESRDNVVTPLSNAEKILVVTEGSTDSFIIKRAMKTLSPDIADFFHFVDMEENYPFTGAGNLFNFCRGLSKIKIQNNVLAIFDNDAAGTESFDQVRNLHRPKNFPGSNVFCGYHLQPDMDVATSKLCNQFEW